jgi:hypothetical protein
MDNSSFTLVFGNSPFVRILDFFLTFEDFDYPVSQIAKETDMKWETAESVIKILLKKRIIQKTRKVGKADLYSLDKKRDVTRLLIETDLKISDFFIKKELERQKAKVIA